MDTLHLDQHISTQFNADLEKLRQQFLEMGYLIERQLVDAVKAIGTTDKALAEKVLDTEKEVDQREVQLDRACMEVLVRRQPAASDLRLVLMVTNATSDLERMGDEAEKIARMALAISDNSGAPKGYVELRHLSRQVVRLVNESLEAFANFDVEAAIRVVKVDNDIDTEYQSSLRELITYMMEDPRSIKRALNIIWALRALERIGDHARNIAEQVIFLVHGEDVRHSSLSEIEQQITPQR